MRCATVVTVSVLCIACALAQPLSKMGRNLSADFIYFPDQAEYIKLLSKCPDNTIMWPGNRRCYREGEQGPCNIGRILVLDNKLFKPYCKDTILQ